MAFVPYQGMKQGWMRQLIAASAPYKSSPAVQNSFARLGCVGHFWDASRGRSVTVGLGEVSIRVPFVFRAAASVSQETAFEGVEVAAQNIAGIFPESEKEKVRVLCNTRTSDTTVSKLC